MRFYWLDASMLTPLSCSHPVRFVRISFFFFAFRFFLEYALTQEHDDVRLAECNWNRATAKKKKKGEICMSKRAMHDRKIFSRINRLIARQKEIY